MTMNQLVRNETNPTLAELLCVGLVFFGLVVTVQFLLGAHAVEFDLWSSDAAGHYLNGLLARDYLAGGFPQFPLQYAKDYHSHYPGIGIGAWPPLYYAIEGPWMFVLGTGRSSVLVLTALMTAATALVTYAFGASRLGRFWGAVAAAALVVSPIVWPESIVPMADIPTALLCFLAAISYIRFLGAPTLSRGVLFGAIAAAAIMTKGNAVALALLPAFVVLLSRDFTLLRTLSFWVPVPVVLILTAPWYFVTYNLTSRGFRFSWGLDYFLHAVSANTQILFHAAGPILFLMGLAGLVRVCLGREGNLTKHSSVVIAALLLSVFIFHSVVPVAIQGRYLIPALIPLILLAVGELRFVTQMLGNRSSRLSAWAPRTGVAAFSLGVLCLGSLVPGLLAHQPPPSLGLINGAEQVWSHRSNANPSVLVATDGFTEGTALVELAAKDPARPSLFAVRGSRLLGAGGFNRHEYVPRFSSPADALAELDKYKIPLILLRVPFQGDLWTHIHQIDQARKLFPDRFETLYSAATGDARVMVLRVKPNDTERADPQQLMQLSAPRKTPGGL